MIVYQIEVIFESFSVLDHCEYCSSQRSAIAEATVARKGSPAPSLVRIRKLRLKDMTPAKMALACLRVHATGPFGRDVGWFGLLEASKVIREWKADS